MRRLSAVIVLLAFLVFGAAAASAGPIITIVNANQATTFTGAVQAPGSGITVVSGSETYAGAANQAGTYTDFTLAPSSGSTPTLTLPDGILLTSGSAILPTTNTLNNFTVALGTPGDADLSALSGTSTFDANWLEFDFTVAPGQTSVEAFFVFGTDEFPTQSVTDIFGFFVDGVNYAKFPNGDLISNTPGNPTNFILNPVGSGLYAIEYNGLTQAFKVVGLLDPTQSTHTLKIAIADTSDTIFDSGVFIGGLVAGTATSGGIGGGDVPEPATLTLFGLALAGAATRLRRRVRS